jgi:serine/threonine-protein kinase
MAAGMPQVGRYEMLTQLGEGGMARVYLAVSRGPVGFNKLVVVKQIRPELASDEEFLGMFSEEARIALRLHHPNIVQTYEIFEEEGQHLMAMEYLDGQSLADLLRRVGREHMPLEEHLWILAQVLQALHHAHEMCDADGLPMAIVHRDVSPSNVFLTYNGDVKLVDFGIAKASGAISTTARGTVKAKLGYGAPEQFLGNPIDARADIFSVGVMMWEALAGCRRKIGETRNAMIEARITGQEPSIRAIRPEVPAALAAICDRATALDPERRHGSAAELAYDIDRWLQGRSRRVGPREVAALVGEFFQDERQAMRTRIEQELGGSDADPTRDLAPRAAQAMQAMMSPGPTPAALVNEPISHSQLYSMDLAPEPSAGQPWTRRRKLMVAGGGAGALAVAALVLALSTSGGSDPTGPGADPKRPRVDLARAPGGEPPVPPPGAPATGRSSATTPTSTTTRGLGLTTGELPGSVEKAHPDPARRPHAVHRRPAAAAETPEPAPEPTPAPEMAAPRAAAVIPPPVAPPGERPAARDSRPERPVPAPVSAGSDRARRGLQPGDDMAHPRRTGSRRQLDEQDPYK